MTRLLARARSGIPRSKDPPVSLARPSLDFSARTLAFGRSLRVEHPREKSGLAKSIRATGQMQRLQVTKSMPRALTPEPIVGLDTTGDTSQSEERILSEQQSIFPVRNNRDP